MSKRQNRRQKQPFKRDTWVTAAFAVMFVAIAVRLLYLQVLGVADIRQEEQKLRQVGVQQTVERGMIVDAQNHILAKSIARYDISVDPDYLRSNLRRLASDNEYSYTELNELIAAKVAAILEMDGAEVLAMTQMSGHWAGLARKVPIETIQLLQTVGKSELGFASEGTLDLCNIGLGLTSTYERLYPRGSLGAGAVGFVQDNGNGAAGIEAYYNDELNGRLNANDSYRSSGYTLKLTLDATVQHLLERELDVAMLESNAASACAIAMDPSTGKILGMASRPTYDPMQFATTDPDLFRNLPISMTYEPGSTFKIITGSIALEESVIAREQLFNDPGFLTLGVNTIGNWDSDTSSHGEITFARAMEISSNVVLGQIGLLIGRDIYMDYLQGFGFGERSRVDLGGEERGMLVSYDMIREIEMATMAFGQANLVTPLQLLTAISAVANGGYLYRPYMLEEIQDTDGQVVSRTEPVLRRQVISAATSRELTNILVHVVDNGTGSRAQIPGIRVAGKTGTAQKIDPETKEYSDEDFIVSFASYAPADNPKIAVLFVIDSPKGVKPQGGALAGPRVKNILEGTLQYYGIPVNATTPDVLEDWSEDSLRTVDEFVMPEVELADGEVMVPQLFGLTLKQAGESLAGLGLLYDFKGSGLAVKQSPLPGTVVNRGSKVEATFGDGEDEGEDDEGANAGGANDSEDGGTESTE